MNRRSLLLGLTGALAAPAIVRADSLMKLWMPLVPKVILPDLSHANWLYDASGKIIGTCKDEGGHVRFHIAREDGYHSGVVSPAAMLRVILNEDVRSYWPRPFA